jgi:hypothetical protein
MLFCHAFNCKQFLEFPEHDSMIILLLLSLVLLFS